MSQSTAISINSGSSEVQSSARPSVLRMAEAGRNFSRQRAFPWILLCGATSLAIINQPITAAYDWVPFFVSLFIFGMPHGAMDWTVQNRLKNLTSLKSQITAFIPYLAWMGGASLLLLFMPLFTVAAFMLLSAIHFGTADHFATGKRDEVSWLRTVFIMGRGSLIIGPAFAFHTQEAWRPFGLLTGVGPLSPSALAFTSGISTFLLVSGAILAFAHIFVTSRSSFSKAAMELFESLLIFALGLFASPLFAIGLYFISTHAYRHTVRLSSPPMAGTQSQSQTQSLWSSIPRMHLESLPLLIPTFIIIPAWSWLQFGGLEPSFIVIATIGFFIISTLPHHLLGLKLPSYRP